MSANPNQPQGQQQPPQNQGQQAQGNVPAQLQQHQALAQQLGINLASIDWGRIGQVLRFVGDLIQHAS
jgi:acyl-coenzyme A thioesterase PaaI-like protein